MIQGGSNRGPLQAFTVWMFLVLTGKVVLLLPYLKTHLHCPNRHIKNPAKKWLASEVLSKFSWQLHWTCFCNLSRLWASCHNLGFKLFPKTKLLSVVYLKCFIRCYMWKGPHTLKDSHWMWLLAMVLMFLALPATFLSVFSLICPFFLIPKPDQFELYAFFSWKLYAGQEAQH